MSSENFAAQGPRVIGLTLPYGKRMGHTNQPMPGLVTSNEIFLARDVFRAAPFGGSLFRVRAGGQQQADDLRILGETAGGSAEEAKVCVSLWKGHFIGRKRHNRNFPLKDKWGCF